MTNLLISISQHPFTPFIIPVIILIVCLLLKGKRPPETIQGVATLLGIFGTFFGIVWALSGLDFTNISSSITDLLNGIYPAFYSSLAGVLLSLWVYLFPNFWKQDEEDMDENVDTDSQILRELRDLNKNIAGDGDSSLNTQILKTRDAITGKQDELKRSFDAFAEKMAENNMKALQDVIERFNEELQEQFGENFKELNKAVGRLLAWQKNYKETIEEVTAEVKNTLETLKLSQESMQTSSDTLQEITRSAASFEKTAKDLKEQLDGMRDTVGEVVQFSKGLDGTAEEIKKNMEDVTNKTLQELGENLKGISEALVRDYEEIQRVFERMKNSL